MTATVSFNVSGKTFEVAQDTVNKHGENMLHSMLQRWTQDPSKPQFIDWDPKLFRYIVAWLRDGHIFLPIAVSKMEILREARFFGLPIKDENIEVDLTQIGQLRKRILEVDDQTTRDMQSKCRKTIGIALAEYLASELVKRMPGKRVAYLYRVESNEPTVCFPGWVKNAQWSLASKETLNLLLAESGYKLGDLNEKWVEARVQ